VRSAVRGLSINQSYSVSARSIVQTAEKGGNIKLIKVSKALHLFELVSMYADYVKRGVRVYFIKEGKCFVLCREVDQTRDIDESNYYLGEPDECCWYADKCNAYGEREIPLTEEEAKTKPLLGECIIEDIYDEYLFVNKRNGITNHLELVKYDA
jgi:hypothetical protein